MKTIINRKKNSQFVPMSLLKKILKKDQINMIENLIEDFEALSSRKFKKELEISEKEIKNNQIFSHDNLCQYESILDK